MRFTAENNIITYVLTEHRSFDERSFNEVDSTILSWLSYLCIPAELQGQTMSAEGLPITELYRTEHFRTMTERTLCREESIVLLASVCASPRFRNIKIRNYVAELDKLEEQQFAAMCYVLNDSVMYVAFRGTDTTVIGWKEDFNMVLDGPIPSQRDAVDYLNLVASRWHGDLMVGGHSKGGNLAVYAAIGCRSIIQEQIRQVFSHDGPGFPEEEIEALNLAPIQSRILKTLPQASLIGFLFRQECDYMVIHSTSHGFGQHSPFTWTVENGSFQVLEHVKSTSRILDGAVNEWVSKLTIDERRQVIESIFQVIESTGEDNFQTLSSNLRENVPTMLSAARDMDRSTRRFILRILRELAASGFRVSRSKISDRIMKIIDEAEDSAKLRRMMVDVNEDEDNQTINNNP